MWDWDFDNLLEKGCNRFRVHLIHNPDRLEELPVCQNEEILTAAASTLVGEGEDLSKDGDFEGAVEKFRQANEWNPELDLNPESKAKAISLKEEVKSH